jgi:hypothetical protein
VGARLCTLIQKSVSSAHHSADATRSPRLLLHTFRARPQFMRGCRRHCVARRGGSGPSLPANDTPCPAGYTRCALRLNVPCVQNDQWPHDPGIAVEFWDVWASRGLSARSLAWSASMHVVWCVGRARVLSSHTLHPTSAHVLHSRLRRKRCTSLRMWPSHSRRLFCST